MALTEGAIIEGKVTGISNFGAFISLPDGQTGLVHISEIATSYVKDIKDHLTMGQTVRVKVLSVDEKGKVSLSIRKAVEQKPAAPRRASSAPRRSNANPAEFDWGYKQPADMSFEDKLSKFKQSSDERMSDLKKSFESKRGSSYKKSMGTF